MRLVAVSCVKNEADIIEAFVRHTLAHADRLVVLDNGSTDDTPSILGALAAEGLPLTVLHDPTLGKYQSRHQTRLMREVAVAQNMADWVLPLDADEFLALPEGAALVPDDAAGDRPIALRWRNYVPETDDNAGQVNPVLRLRHRLETEGWPVRKVLVPRTLAARADTRLAQGNHEVRAGERLIEPVEHRSAYLAHFLVRSPGQYLAKVVVNHLQYQSMPNAEASWGVQYRESYKCLMSDPESFAAGLRDAACRYGLPPGVEPLRRTVSDPFRYRGGPLRYTRHHGALADGWRVVLDYAEGLARRHARPAICRAEDGELLRQRPVEPLAAARDDLARCVQMQTALHVELEKARDQIRRQQEEMAQAREALRDLDHALRHSWTWRVGRVVVGPLSWLKSVRTKGRSALHSLLGPAKMTTPDGAVRVPACSPTGACNLSPR